MCLSNKQTNTRYCLFDRLEKFCLFVWSEVVKRTKQSVQVLFGDHPVGHMAMKFTDKRKRDSEERVNGLGQARKSRAKSEYSRANTRGRLGGQAGRT